MEEERRPPSRPKTPTTPTTPTRSRRDLPAPVHVTLVSVAAPTAESASSRRASEAGKEQQPPPKPVGAAGRKLTRRVSSSEVVSEKPCTLEPLPDAIKDTFAALLFADSEEAAQRPPLEELDSDFDAEAEDLLEEEEEPLEKQFRFTGMTAALSTPIDSEVAAYLRACDASDTVPVSFIERNFRQPHLVMNSHGLGCSRGAALARGLEGNQRISHLELRDNAISGAGAGAFAQLILTNRALHNLDLSENQLGSVGMAALAPALAAKSALTTLVLEGNNFFDLDAPQLSKAMARNTTLLALRLGDNRFGDASGSHFAAMLADNHTLEELDLSGNCFRARGIAALAPGLASNNALVALILARNGMLGCDVRWCVSYHLTPFFLFPHPPFFSLDLALSRLSAFFLFV